MFILLTLDSGYPRRNRLTIASRPDPFEAVEGLMKVDKITNYSPLFASHRSAHQANPR